MGDLTDRFEELEIVIVADWWGVWPVDFVYLLYFGEGFHDVCCRLKTLADFVKQGGGGAVLKQTQGSLP